MEACVARSTIRNAGEMNGFLKPKAHLLSAPLRFADGALQLEAGFTPEIDRDALEAHALAVERLEVPRRAAATA
jgi:L-Ala-D/L-Glu epimerase